MVLRGAIGNLRERPKDEKHAIATSVAIGVVAILFIGWLFYVLHSFETTPGPNFQNAATASDTSALQQAQQQVIQAYGSTTQFVTSDTGTIQLEEVGSSTEPSL